LAGITGAEYGEVEVSCSENFTELYPERNLPPFVWLKVDGAEGADDFFIAEDGRLVVSERAWDVIRPFAKNAIVSSYAA
jgi:hypothetical protein